MLENLRPLTQDQRQSAYRAACQVAVRSIGPKPTRDQFSSTTISRYPGSVTRLISGLCLLPATVLPAEIEQVVFSQALATLGTTPLPGSSCMPAWACAHRWP